MDLGAAGLSRQPFPTHGKPLAIVSYASRAAAIEMLRNTCEHPTGLSLLQGPALSGKSTLIRTFVDSLHEDCSVAVIDGKGLNTTKFLTSVLRQFGYELDLNSANELLGLVRVFALQQAASHEAPMLIIENAHELNPSALRALCELAELRVQRGSAMKMVLVSDRSLQAMMAASAMASIAKRIVDDFHLRPMNREETRNFLHTKLRAAGCKYPEFVFADEICIDIWRASAGWPGIIDRVALLALAQSDTLPVAITNIEHPSLPSGTWDDTALVEDAANQNGSPEPPRFIVTINGKTIDELAMESSRFLIGRSEHNDISINSRFISRHHSLFVRHGTTTFLMDLNSTNGTFVNSKRVSNHVLIHDDIITVGHHRIKFHDPYATSRQRPESEEFADTVIMKTLDDMRNLLAQENTAVLPTVTEDVPTLHPGS